MSTFEAALPNLQEIEGGFQIDPNDPGNYNLDGDLVGTNHGVSGRFYDRITEETITEEDVRNLTKIEAQQIFKEHFWNAYEIGRINNQQIANQVFDMFVNHKPETARSLINKALEEVYTGPDTGISGPIDWIDKINYISNQGKAVTFNNTLADIRTNWMEANAPEGWVEILMNRAQSFIIDNPLASLGVVLAVMAIGVGANKLLS